jgi:N,N'-diacetyllegionaminate synthase
MKKIKIGNKTVDKGEPCFVIAEAGVNHNGNLELACKMVDAAKAAGADAVKFQTWKTAEIVTAQVEKPKYQVSSDGKSQLELLKTLELPDEDFRKLAEHAKDKGIMFLSTPEGYGCIDFIDSLGVPAFKVGSADLNNHPALFYMAKKGKPIILSTGMATLAEIKEAVDVIEGAGNCDIILLHCTSNYPTSLENVNLNAMVSMEKEFQIPVGYSDHTMSVGVSIMADLMGACVIEKHFTLDRNLPGPDQSFSLEPNELKNMIKGIRLADKKKPVKQGLEVEMAEIAKKVPIENEVLSGVALILGKAAKKPTATEEEMIRLARKYIVAEMQIPKNTVISLGMLSIKRCGGGLDSKYLKDIVGKKANRTIKKDEAVTLEKVSL